MRHKRSKKRHTGQLFGQMEPTHRQTNSDHYGNQLPASVFGTARTGDGVIVGYRARWREEDEDGIMRHRARSFSVRKFGSQDRALDAATSFLEGAREALWIDGSVSLPDTSRAMTVEEVFREWIVSHAPTLSRGYAEKSIRLWDREIASRSISKVRLEKISEDTSVLVRFQDRLVTEGVSISKRRGILKLLRAVLRWGRYRHPNALDIELSGLIRLPRQNRKRLPYAADAYGLERIIEAVLRRPSRDELLPLRDAAFVAAMGYTIASRPSEWRYSATWADLHETTVELQRASRTYSGGVEGLKTGARAALLLPNAKERIETYREALEERYGPQPGDALVFQVLGEDGPVWAEGAGGRTPLAWSDNDYVRWTARVWKPARAIAAQAPDAPAGLEKMTFYDCRHSAISMALHSTIVAGPYGMNLHPLAGWSGHDIATLQRYYAHSIARYHGQPPIDLEQEGRRARRAVERSPFTPDERAGPQREAQRRRRARATYERERQRRMGEAHAADGQR